MKLKEYKKLDYESFEHIFSYYCNGIVVTGLDNPKTTKADAQYVDWYILLPAIMDEDERVRLLGKNYQAITKDALSDMRRGIIPVRQYIADLFAKEDAVDIISRHFQKKVPHAFIGANRKRIIDEYWRVIRVDEDIPLKYKERFKQQKIAATYEVEASNEQPGKSQDLSVLCMFLASVFVFAVHGKKLIDEELALNPMVKQVLSDLSNGTRMNLVMRGILPDNIVTRNGDTLEEDWPFFDEEHVYSPLYVDAVVSNPPYSQHWEPTEDKKHDPRYANYGMAPKSKADYAFLLHDLFHLKPDGIMTIVLPHGVLFRGGEEGDIRRNLIEKNNVDAIIGLPANIFFGTGIPTIIMVLKQKRTNTDVLIIDASKHFEKVGKNNKLRASDIKRIVDVVTQRKSVEKFSRVVTRNEIRQNEYNLNIPRYVDSSEAAESWDILATMSGGIPNAEIDALHEYWEAFPNLRKEIFHSDGTPYSTLAADDVAAAIKNSGDVKAFTDGFSGAFGDFSKYLREKLINNLHSMEITTNEEEISSNIFGRLATVPLVDRYEAYQLLDGSWSVISSDLETIQRDGFSATKAVDPNMVLKKKGGTEEEVQEGWVGRIIPFELAQKEFLYAEMAALKAHEDRLTEIASSYC